MATDKQRVRGRPKDLEKRAAIIGAARRLFFDRGLEVVKMDEVAVEAGVSKMTVYKNFEDKNALFEAVVNAESLTIEDEFARLEIKSNQIDLVLIGYGVTFLTFLFSPQIIRMDRVMSAEMGRHPELGQRFYRAGPLRIWEMLTKIIEAACDRNELRCSKPQRAAEHLISLWLGLLPMQHRFEIQQPVSSNEIKDRVTEGVEIFMQTFKP